MRRFAYETSRISFLLIVVLTLANRAVADQIVLKNGDRLTGTIVKSDGKTLVLKSDLIGEVAIALDDIANVTADKPLYVTLTDGRTVSGLVTAKNSQFEIKSNSGAVVVERSAIAIVRSEAEQRAYESTLNPGWLEQWSGGADLGFALTRGNSHTTNFALGMAISRETLRDKTSLYAASIYNRENTNGISRTVANTFRFGARYDRDINRQWFGYGFTDLEHNGLQDLNLRWVLGGGLGYHAIRSERTKLDLLGGLDVSREFFDGNDNDRTSLEAQLGQTLTHQLTPRLALKEQLFFFPNLSEGGEYRINFDTSLVADITRRIGWQITISDRYLSNPPGGAKQNDLLLTTGLKVRLGTLK
jgi:putative salt-induced outer membrane protein YdiY/small nuclear ribonucleoprotein (snRNP)-like protein